MKTKYLSLILTLAAVGSAACTFNVGTTPTAANAPAANTANSAPFPSNAAVNTAAAPKKEETAKKTEPVPNSSSDKGVRIQFAKGETSTFMTKDIPAKGSVDFLMNVQKGQTIGYTVGYDFADTDVEAFLTEPGSQDISQTAGPKEPQEFSVSKSGDHRLTVNNTTGKKITVTLYLDIE